MAWQRRAGTQPAEQGTAGKHSRRTLRPAQASKTTASSWPASQQNHSRRQSWPASRRAVQVDGGSAVVLAARKAGSDLPNLSPSHLSPLPVTVSTHSLNFEQPNLAPNIFFCVFFFLIYFSTSQLETRPLTPFNVYVRLSYVSPTASLLPTPTFPSQRGIGEGWRPMPRPNTSLWMASS